MEIVYENIYLYAEYIVGIRDGADFSRVESSSHVTTPLARRLILSRMEMLVEICYLHYCFEINVIKTRYLSNLKNLINRFIDSLKYFAYPEKEQSTC